VPAATNADLAFAVAVEDRPTANRVGAQGSSHLDEDGSLLAKSNLDLLA
jgi:hypothetical protein